MPYSSSLTDEEWKLIESLLPQKKQTKPLGWTKRISKLQNKNKGFG
jgi:transposase